VISLAVTAAGWVGLLHPEITPPSNFHQLRDTTTDTGPAGCGDRPAASPGRSGERRGHCRAV